MEREAAERTAGVTKISLSAERQVDRSRSAHALHTTSAKHWSPLLNSGEYLLTYISRFAALGVACT